MRRFRTTVVLALATFVCLLLSPIVAIAQVAVTTYHNDNYRSGSNAQETVLTPSNVKMQTFGKRLSFPVLGAVYAQPLYVPNLTIGQSRHNVLFVATEHDQAYAFDVDTGQQLWHTDFLLSLSFRYVITPVSSGDVTCDDLAPEIGITGTPVIDTHTGTIYLVVRTKQYDRTNPLTVTFYQTLHALDITTGRDKVPPLHISAAVSGTSGGSLASVLAFDPVIENQREALLLLQGQVFIGWGSHCDHGPFHGWLMSFNESDLSPSGVFVDTPNGRFSGGGIWGGGPAADSGGSIYVATGNGTFDGTSDFGDSILRLTWSAINMSITVSDYFTPWDQQTLDDNDYDLGSGDAVLLPDQPGTPYPHLLVQAGKEGTIDLVNRDNMGHWHSGDDSQIVQTIPYAISSNFNSPAFWNNNAYFGGSGDQLKAYAFDPQAQKLSTTYTSKSPERFGGMGVTPSVSSNTTNNGIVWVVQHTQTTNILHAFDATNLGTELYNSEQNPSRDRVGPAVKFTLPTIADGKVFAPSVNQVVMYGLLGQ